VHADASSPKRNRFNQWWHGTFHDWFFRSMIGPAQTSNALHGAEKEAREHWKRDLAARKRYTREQRERRQTAREAEHRD
jgi:hypothetical protein